MEPNPYETPRTESKPSFSDETPQTDLERRVAELERCLSQSWLCGPNILKRVVGVWGYLLIGYVAILIIAAPLVMIMNWLGF